MDLGLSNLTAKEAGHGLKQQLSARIADCIRELIRDNNFRPGDKLPSQAQLTQSHSVGTQTVRHALAMLIHEGLIEARQGSGYFVISPRSQLDLAHPQFKALQKGVVRYQSVTQKEVITPTERLMAMLGLGDDATILRARRLIIIGEKTIGLETANIPTTLAGLFSESDLDHGDYLEVLAGCDGISIASIDVTLRIGVMSDFDAELLSMLPRDKVMMQRFEVFRNDDGRPLIMTRVTLDPEQVEFCGTVTVSAPR